MTATPNPTPPQPGVTGIPTGLLIGAGWRDASDGKVFEVECPATGEVLATVADGGPADADDALAGAVAAQASWARTAPRYRSEILRRAYDLVMARQDWLAEVMTLEMGKPLAEAKGEVAYAAEFLRWFSEEAVRISGDHTTTGDGGNRIIVTLECTEARGLGKSPSRYTTMKNKKNNPKRMELKKYNPFLQRHTLHKEIK